MALDKDLIDKLLEGYQKPEDLIGENGLLKQLTKALVERALNAELTHRLLKASTTRSYPLMN
jgi:putative transposase